ncbi:hypothetical protein I7I48_03218 [Histoplasma ohiense]|nr:hypothetical protein I7I48_03218 [Histoplasma ohiense (nom. inval.)]
MKTAYRTSKSREKNRRTTNIMPEIIAPSAPSCPSHSSPEPFQSTQPNPPIQSSVETVHVRLTRIQQ